MTVPRPRDRAAVPWSAYALHAAVALLVVAAGLAFAPAFGSALTFGDPAPAALLVAIVVAAVVPAVTTALAHRLELDVAVAAAGGLAVTLLAVGIATRPGTAVFSGPYRLLTAALPAEADGPACAAVGTLVGLASLASALLAAYSRHRSLAVLPAFVVIVAGLALDAGIAQPPTSYVAVMLVPLGLVLSLARNRPTTPSGAASLGAVRLVRRVFPVAGAIAIFAAGAVVATAFSADLPAVTSKPADARGLVDAPIKPRNAVNPMLQYPVLADGTQKINFSGTATRRVDRLTLVTLDDFTGRTWTTSAGYRRAGTQLQRDGAGDDAAEVTVDVRVRQPGSLNWLLRPDRPTGIDRTDLGVDEATGDIVVPAGTSYPKRYRVTGVTDPAPDTTLATQRVARLTGAPAAAARRAPKLIRDVAGRARTGRTDLQVLQTLQAQLRGGDYFLDDTETPRAGNGYFQISQLLRGTGRHLGTSEQYASAFAVMARVLGYNSRLVLGFQPDFAANGRTFTVSGRDVHAWAQVRFADAGWVTFDATPSRAASNNRAPDEPAAGGATPSSTPPKSSSSAAPTAVPNTSPSAQAAGNRGDESSSVLLLVVLGVLIVVIVVLVPPGAKYGRRRRRRGAPVPAHAVYGAWRETTDRLAELGRPAQRGRTASEVAADAPRPARDDVRALGRILDRAGYAPEDANPADAAAAWQHADAARERIGATVPPWRRVLAALDPRPLWRR